MGIGPAELIVLGTLAVPLALIVIAVTRNRPSLDRFVTVNRLELDPTNAARVAGALSRTRHSRVAGAWVGLGAGILAGAGMNLATGLGTEWTEVLAATAGILIGTFVGIAAAQRAPRRDASPVRHAGLEVRDVDAYRTPHGTVLIRIAVGVFLVAVALVLVAATHDVAVTITATVVIAVGALAFVGWAHRLGVGIVERGRDAEDPVGAALDDLLRSCSVRAIQHATIGVLACGVGLLALLGINTQSYEAVKIDNRTVLEVPDGGQLDEVITEPDLSVRVSRTTPIVIRWTDADGGTHTTTRLLPPTAYLGYGNYVDTELAISLGGLGFTAGWIVGIIEWSRASKAWRRPTAPRTPAPTPLAESA